MLLNVTDKQKEDKIPPLFSTWVPTLFFSLVLFTLVLSLLYGLGCISIPA